MILPSIKKFYKWWIGIILSSFILLFAFNTQAYVLKDETTDSRSNATSLTGRTGSNSNDDFTFVTLRFNPTTSYALHSVKLIIDKSNLVGEDDIAVQLYNFSGTDNDPLAGSSLATSDILQGSTFHEYAGYASMTKQEFVFSSPYQVTGGNAYVFKIYMPNGGATSGNFAIVMGDGGMTPERKMYSWDAYTSTWNTQGHGYYQTYTYSDGQIFITAPTDSSTVTILPFNVVFTYWLDVDTEYNFINFQIEGGDQYILQNYYVPLGGGECQGCTATQKITHLGGGEYSLTASFYSESADVYGAETVINFTMSYDPEQSTDLGAPVIMPEVSYNDVAFGMYNSPTGLFNTGKSTIDVALRPMLKVSSAFANYFSGNTDLITGQTMGNNVSTVFGYLNGFNDIFSGIPMSYIFILFICFLIIATVKKIIMTIHPTKK